LPLIDAHSEQHGGFLPLGQLESEDMIGSLIHWLPLVTGHTGYPPIHRDLLMTVLRGLPRSDALDELTDLTHVRWLLLRPPDYWANVRLPGRLANAKGGTLLLTSEGWALVRIDRPVHHPEWYAALARGYRKGETILGTPLDPLPESAAIA